MDGNVDPRVLLAAGPWGQAALAFFCASLAFALLGALLTLFGARPHASRRVAIAGGLSAGAGALGVGACLWHCHRSGAAILGALGSRDFHDEWARAIEEMESTYLTVGLWLFGLGCLAALGAGARRVRAHDEVASPGRALPLSCAFVLLTTAAGVLWRAQLARDPERGAALGVAAVVWLVEKGHALLPYTRVAVVGAALLGSLAVLACARRAKPTAGSRRAWTAAVAAAGLGLSSWAASRPLAHDAEHPLSFPHDAFAYHDCPTLLRSDPATLPRMEAKGRPCTDLTSEDIIPLALLDLGGTGPTADGHPLQDALSAFDHVNTMRLLRDAGNPPGHWSVVLIAAPASMPAEELGPWLAAVANPNQRFALVLLHDQPPVVTATAGTLAREPRCSCPRVTLEPGGTSLAAKRWGEVASAAAARPEDAPLAVDPGYSLQFDGSSRAIVKSSPP